MLAPRLVAVLVSLAIASCASPAARPAVEAPKPAPSLEQAQKSALERGLEALESSRYAEAETAFRAALDAAANRGGESTARGRALAGLSEVALTTGRYAEAARLARELAAVAAGARVQGAVLEARALARQGKIEEAEAVVRRVAERPEARSARLLLGELLLEQGRRADAEPVLMTLIEDYNQERIEPKDAGALAEVGRAADLLRSPRDANDAFNEAERAAPANEQLLLYRVELFLQNYDPGHAEQALEELLEKAPHHPLAKVRLAEVRLAQALDFDAAERLAREALEVNPNLPEAYFVLAGVALRDMEIEAAERLIRSGLASNPRNLELFSLRATARFLADDVAGFERAKREVLLLNPEYSRLYQIVGDFADWEHRYREIVSLMREAVALDSEDARALGQLGLNLIRAGEEQPGVDALARAFDLDPYNVRVFNTLELYEKTIPRDYLSERHAQFSIRYPKAEKAVLERYVPDLLDAAFRKFQRHYGFSPKSPVGVEIYAKREHFSIRTSGLPATAIQGVCFGETLATLAPGEEKFNLGMTLWHELAHVFHIQLANSRVPRWFTEGLAEYETLIERKEWAREQDPELFAALRENRLPKLADMSRAFTRAENIGDIAMAYYASARLVTFLAERFGTERFPAMLAGWSKGERTPKVLEDVLGQSADELDREFRRWLSRELGRYGEQFVPLSRGGPVEKAEAQAKANPRDARAQTGWALALLAAGQAGAAKKTLRRALALDPKQPDARFVAARIASAEGDHGAARRSLEALAADGHDGYAVAAALAEVMSELGRTDDARRALTQARAFDPTQSAPLYALLRDAVKRGDKKAQLDYARALAELEQHDPGIYRLLLSLLLDAGLTQEAVVWGEAAVYADVEGFEVHRLYARALAAEGKLDKALYELESAVACRAGPEDLGEAHAELAELLVRRDEREKAREHAKKARELAPNHARARKRLEASGL
ncbi:MAG TPA: tetratricopeptide repeat protein [Polyangiaceae bacterium]